MDRLGQLLEALRAPSDGSLCSRLSMICLPPSAGPGSLQPCITDVQNRETSWARWRQQEADRLGGWFMTTLVDGWIDGKPAHWYDYEHLDGRKASVLNGRSTDPELQAVLDAERLKDVSSPSVQSRPFFFVGSSFANLVRRLFASRK